LQTPLFLGENKNRVISITNLKHMDDLMEWVFTDDPDMEEEQL
jgi:hypothetical protein